MAYRNSFQSVVCEPQGSGVSEILAEGLQGQTYFHNNTMKLFALFHSVDTCTNDTKVMSEIAGSLVQIKAITTKVYM